MSSVVRLEGIRIYDVMSALEDLARSMAYDREDMTRGDRMQIAGAINQCIYTPVDDHLDSIDIKLGEI